VIPIYILLLLRISFFNVVEVVWGLLLRFLCAHSYRPEPHAIDKTLPKVLCPTPTSALKEHIEVVVINPKRVNIS
jgi:hypothetical protein